MAPCPGSPSEPACYPAHPAYPQRWGFGLGEDHSRESVELHKPLSCGQAAGSAGRARTSALPRDRVPARRSWRAELAPHPPQRQHRPGRQRPKGSVLTPATSGHATPSAVLSSSRPAGARSTFRHQLPGRASAHPPGATGTESALQTNPVTPIRLSGPRGVTPLIQHLRQAASEPPLQGLGGLSALVVPAGVMAGKGSFPLVGHLGQTNPGEEVSAG